MLRVHHYLLDQRYSMHLTRPHWMMWRWVILGQDPYHGQDKPGLSFSVPQALSPPIWSISSKPSTDLDISIPSHGDLSMGNTRLYYLINVNCAGTRSIIPQGYRMANLQILDWKVIRTPWSHRIYAVGALCSAKRTTDTGGPPNLKVFTPLLSAHRGFDE